MSTAAARSSNLNSVPTGTVQKVVAQITAGNVTPVTVDAFTARADGAGVLLDWHAASEFQNLGFNVYRRSLKHANVVSRQRVSDFRPPNQRRRQDVSSLRLEPQRRALRIQTRIAQSHDGVKAVYSEQRSRQRRGIDAPVPEALDAVVAGFEAQEAAAISQK